MMETTLGALADVLALKCLTAIVIGTGLGVVIGAMPGLGSILGLTIMLPFTYGMGNLESIALLLGVYAGSVYGGSIAAILINTPGTPQSAATAFDGHALALRGEAGAAIGWATSASLVGGIFSSIVLILIASPLAQLSLRFGPPEFFALALTATICVAAVSRDGLVKGMLAGTIGLFLGVVGPDPMTGDIRFNFDIFALSAGFDTVAILIGVFGLSEVFVRSFRASEVSEYPKSGLAFRLPGFAQWKPRLPTLIKSSVIGTLIGIMPGTGATAASFVSYLEAKRAGRFRDKLGEGEPEGIVASEAANNAVTGGALVPSLALGIPGDAVTALIVSVLVIKGVQPGPFLFIQQPQLVQSIYIVFIVINIVMFGFGVLLTPVFTRVMQAPDHFLIALIAVFSLVGSYTLNANPMDVFTCLGAGLIGFLLRLARFPLAALAIGLVLGPLLEVSLRQSLIITDGSFIGIFTRPIAGVIGMIALLLILWPLAARALAQMTGHGTTHSTRPKE